MLTITLLGTAATMPLPERALTAAVAECGGHSLLLDCGEGTQTAARRAGVNLMRADAICLTHYHGDHIFGLPGLLQTLGRRGAPARWCCWGRRGFCRGLAGGVCPDRAAALRGKAAGLPRRTACGAGCSFGWMARRGNAAPVATKHRVRSLGYRLDLPRAGRFDPEKARALGVPVPQWRLLQRGTGCPAGRANGAARRGAGRAPQGAAVRLFRRHRPLPGAGTGRAGGRPAALRCHLCPAGAAGAGRHSGGTAPLAKARRWRQKLV